MSTIVIGGEGPVICGCERHNIPLHHTAQRRWRSFFFSYGAGGYLINQINQKSNEKTEGK